MSVKTAFRFSCAIAVTGALIGILSGLGCHGKLSYEKVLKRNSEAMNKKCPILIDESTRMDSTSAGPGKRFAYYYTLIRQVRDSIDVKSMDLNLKPRLIGNLRTNKSLEMLRNNKASIEYVFFDRKGRFVLSIPVTPEDYK